MLIVMLNHIKRSTFLTPFFIGALVCSLVGGFFHLVLLFAVVWLSLALLDRIFKPNIQTV